MPLPHPLVLPAPNSAPSTGSNHLWGREPGKSHCNADQLLFPCLFYKHPISFDQYLNNPFNIPEPAASARESRSWDCSGQGQESPASILTQIDVVLLNLPQRVWLLSAQADVKDDMAWD